MENENGSQNGKASPDRQGKNAPEIFSSDNRQRRSRLKSPQQSSVKGKGGITLSEALGYVASCIFFGIAAFVASGQFGDATWNTQYRWTVTGILILYGLYRIVITRSRALAAARRKRVNNLRLGISERQVDEDPQP